jgi:DNA damage-binding protein 1
MILSIESVVLGINMPPVSTKSRSTDNATLAEYRPFIVMGTAFAYPDEDEPSHGRVLVIECSCGRYDDLKSESQDEMVRQVRQVADLPLTGGIYSIAPFYGGNILVTCGSDTIICQLAASILPREHGGESGELILNRIGTGHHGHLISLCVKSLVSTDKSLQKRRVKKQLAIVGDLMRSISLIEYYPKHQVIEELASDFNSNFCTDVAMLTDNIYMGSEGHNNLFVLRYNPNATTEQARCRLDTVGQYHLGENVNKMIGGSLVMPSNSATCGRGAMSASGTLSSPDETSPGGDRKVDITIGSQTLYGTVDGTIGSVLGLGGKTYAFLSALQRAMNAIVRPVGDLSHSHFRAWRQDQNRHGACGFVDGDWIETFLDLNRPTMEQVVEEMNADPRWSIKDDGKGFDRARDGVRQNLIDTDEGMGADPPSASNLRTLSVEDVLGAVEELSMLH